MTAELTLGLVAAVLILGFLLGEQAERERARRANRRRRARNRRVIRQALR